MNPLHVTKTLYTCSVGELANVVRNHAALGAYAAVPTDVSTFVQAARTEIVEPGRLEVRERLYYAELDKIILSAETMNGLATGDAKPDMEDEEKPARVKPADPEDALEQLLLSRLAGESVYRSRKH